LACVSTSVPPPDLTMPAPAMGFVNAASIVAVAPAFTAMVAGLLDSVKASPVSM
jgi:hypothetical protein